MKKALITGITGQDGSYLAEFLLEKDTVDVLLDCYVFLRKVEHRLQSYKDQQTQELPNDEQQRQNLAQGLNFSDWSSFRTETALRMETIHHHFSTLFQDNNKQTNESKANLVFHDIWQDFTSIESNLEVLLEQSGFTDVVEIATLLSSFRNSSSVRHMGPRGAKRLDQLMPMILQTIVLMKAQTESLNRILKLLSSITRRTAYLELLAENKEALTQMINLCSASVRIADQISDYPYILDELINPGTLFHPPEPSSYPDMLRQVLCRLPEDDPEVMMDSLREFRQINLLRVTAADIVGVLSIKQLSHSLTAIAETVINSVIHIAWQELSIKHGNPRSKDVDAEMTNATSVQVHSFAVVAYGKLGGYELGYGSDLDLVFLHESARGLTDGAKPIESSIFYMRLAQKIIHLLSIRTRSGVLYEVDMRLRPSGNSGMLVSPIDAFIEYQEESAWTWEHQALIKGRCIFGSDSLRNKFGKLRTSILCRIRDDEELSMQVKLMREKMRDSLLEQNLDVQGLYDLKQSKGGVADIEFLTQYLVLKLASKDAGLSCSTNTSELLSNLAHNDNLGESRLKKLISIYADLRHLINGNALQNRTNNIALESISNVDIQLVNQLWSDLL